MNTYHVQLQGLPSYVNAAHNGTGAPGMQHCWAVPVTKHLQLSVQTLEVRDEVADAV